MHKQFLALSLLAAASTALADNGSFSLGSGFDYSTGKYGGTTSTSILYIPVTGRYTSDKWTLELTVPYIQITGVGNVIPGVGHVGRPVTPTTTTTTTTQSGMGDVTAGATYYFFDSAKLLLGAAGNVKFGTASAQKSLGTGENDYSAQLDGYYFMGKTTLFGTLGYKLIGAPEGVVANNIAFGTAGISQWLDDKLSAGLMLDAAQRINDTNPGTRVLTLFMSNRLSPDLKLQANLIKGLSEASPDYGVGFRLWGTY
jgi:hypothetical protein